MIGQETGIDLTQERIRFFYLYESHWTSYNFVHVCFQPRPVNLLN